MYRSQYFEGGRILTAAISAIDIALHDVVARSLGVPVYQLLGGAQRDYVPCFATSGARMSPDVVEDTKRLISDGWSVIRYGPDHPGPERPGALTGTMLFEPRESIALTAEWLTKVREAVGLAPVLGIDYHHRLSVAEAAAFCQMMPSGTLNFLGEPIRDETPGAYESLRSMTDVPFAIGEEFSNSGRSCPMLSRASRTSRASMCATSGVSRRP